MEATEYRFMAEHEDRHWWFVGRRAVLATLLDGLVLPAGARILEIGCGTGGNLPLLGRYGRVTALEMNGDARAFARQKTGVDVCGWYSRASLRRLLVAGGYAVERTSFFNALLFLPMVAVRLADRWLGRSTASGSALPPPVANRLLTSMFGAEAHWLRRRNLPFGLSLLALARRAG